MEETRANIIKSLVYFTMFKHPLSKEELIQFHAAKIEPSVISEAIDSLVKDKIVFESEGFFSLQKNQEWIDRRKAGNARAKKAIKRAIQTGSRIAQLPFIRSVSLSGTIAKGVMYEDSDVDYFIIAQVNRIWLAKLVLKLYKLIFHFNSSKNLCYNYLLSENSLLVSAQNIYTATEISTLVPISLNITFKKFLQTNSWVSNYFPNTDLIKKSQYSLSVNKTENQISNWIENLFQGASGDRLDNRIMYKIQHNYQQKYQAELMEEAMKSTKDVSKTTSE